MACITTSQRLTCIRYLAEFDFRYHKGEHRFFLRCLAFPVPRLAADVGFVGFNELAFAAERARSAGVHR
jgi:hypothetical protein